MGRRFESELRVKAMKWVVPALMLTGCSAASGADAGDASVDAGEFSDAGDTRPLNARCPPATHPQGECGSCVESLADFCARSSDCGGRDTYACYSQFVWRTTEETGCGFVRFTRRGPEGETFGRTYDLDSGVLLYVFDYGRYGVSPVCADAHFVGTEPTCDAWISAPCP